MLSRLIEDGVLFYSSIRYILASNGQCDVPPLLSGKESQITFYLVVHLHVQLLVLSALSVVKFLKMFLAVLQNVSLSRVIYQKSLDLLNSALNIKIAGSFEVTSFSMEAIVLNDSMMGNTADGD